MKYLDEDTNNTATHSLFIFFKYFKYEIEIYVLFVSDI